MFTQLTVIQNVFIDVVVQEINQTVTDEDVVHCKEIVKDIKVTKC